MANFGQCHRGSINLHCHYIAAASSLHRHFIVNTSSIHRQCIAIFPQQPSGLGFQSLNPGLNYLNGSSFGQVHGGSMNHIGTTSSLHFLIRSKLHCNGQVHGGSMNHIDPTSSLHFLIRNKLHRNGEVHRGSMNH